MSRKRFPSDTRCYNCGMIVPNEYKTVEHIPMQGLYKGFPGYENRHTVIKVCGCMTCNRKYSFIESRLRDLVAIIGSLKSRNDLSEIVKASAKSIQYNKELRGWFLKCNDDKILLNFDYHDFDDIHIKNFKGIIYKEFDFPLLDDEYKFRVGSDCGIENREDNQVNSLLDILRSFSLRQTDWNESGNPDIFKYRLGYDFDLKGKRPERIQDIDIIHCMMIYHNLIFAHVIAYRNDIYEKFCQI